MEALIRTLVIEDDAAYAELLGEMLARGGKPGFSVESAGSLASGLERLASGHFDLVLLDLCLPDAEGFVVCERVHAAAPTLPIIIVSGSEVEEEFMVECLQRGVQDYLVKDGLDRTLLMRSVRYALQRKKIETEHRKFEHALKEANRELLEKVRELDRLNATMMDREERILELKEEIKKLKALITENRRMAA